MLLLLALLACATAPDCEAPERFCPDGDRDGWGACGPDEEPVEACSAPGGYALATPTDCNDEDATVNPGAIQECDGPDVNCNNIAMEGC